MSNEIISVSIPQFDDDIDVFEDLRVILATKGFNYLDMAPEYNTESIVYRFQKSDGSG
jgi:hypothetical protein